MPAPETAAREAIIKALEETYAEEAFQVRSDKLHPSLGDAGTVIGVSPDHTQHGRNALVSEMHILVQFYGHYLKEVRRDQRVDPAVVEAYAERFRAKLRTGTVDLHTGDNWFFMLDRVKFPPDPTGNITRFEANLTAVGNNTALLETA